MSTFPVSTVNEVHPLLGVTSAPPVKRTPLCSALLIVLAIFTAAPGFSFDSIADVRQPVSDPCLMKTFASMVRYATGGIHGTEIAGFLIANTDDSLTFQQWPSLAGVWRESYKGKIPEHVVAIVHTHPLSWSSPSSKDISESVRVGLPVYVVSEWRIWVIDPELRRADVLATTGWKRSAQVDQRCQQWTEARSRVQSAPTGPGSAVATGD